MEKEEIKRVEYLERQRIAEERKRQIEEQERIELKVRKEREIEKEAQLKKVREQIENEKGIQKESIMAKIDIKDEKVKKTKEEIQKARKEKAGAALIERRDKEEAVKKITRIQEYQREQLMTKLEMKDEKAMKIKLEKAALLEARQNLRKQAAIQKHKAMEEFEKLKMKKKNEQSVDQIISRSTTEKPRSANQRSQEIYKNRSMQQTMKTPSNKLTIAQHKKSSPKKQLTEEEAIQKVEALRIKLRQDLLNILQEEQKKELAREEIMKNANPEERAILEKNYGLERAQSSDKIVALS